MGVGRADVLLIVPDLTPGDGKAIAGDPEGDTGSADLHEPIFQRDPNASAMFWSTTVMA